MKRLFALFIFSAWFAVQAFGANLGGTTTFATTPQGGGYIGPGDLSINSSILVWGGFSCYSSTYSGNVAAISDSNAATTSFTMSCAGGVLSATNGAGGTISTLVTDCNSSHAYCTISTWYDQSGKTNCTGTACDVICVLSCQVFSNCPSFTAPIAFCYEAVPSGTGRLLTNNNFNPTTSTPFSMILPILFIG